MNDFTSLLQQGNAAVYTQRNTARRAARPRTGPFKNDDGRLYRGGTGTLKQAVLLGLAATVSHTAVVWLIAMAGLWFGRGWNAQTSEPRFQLVSGIVIVLIACWMLWRTARIAASHAP